MLIGMFPPSTGTAKICGFDLRNELRKVHEIMGVCPQFDILWEELSAKEHLYFYGRLRNIPKEVLPSATDKVLKKLNLYEVRNIPAKKYSGV